MRRVRTISILMILGLVLATGVAFAAEDGKALYEQKCASCHGKDGVAKPMAKGSANLNDPNYQKTATVESIAKVTMDGKNKMPAYKDKLNADQINAIAAHVKTLK
ncbi:MAG TPA: cytochrome c [Candidatus Polarisedimenticolaceae bacterium]|nr:cytochrome c [Candidatus Polarisedimenticolaceae bacterium]